MPTIATALAALALLGAACGGSNGSANEAEVSAGSQPQAPDATDASEVGGSGADDASDLDDAVSNSNDGEAASGDEGDSADEQPVVGPDGTETFGPQEGEREQAEIIDVQRVVRESWPLQLAVIISGEMRDGCQELAWEMRPDGTTYHVTVWQVVPPANAEMACTMAIVPFETQIELGTSETDDFTVIVNGLAY